MKRVVTFGEIMLRLAPNGYYRFFQNDQMQATFGGGEANVAVSLANYGLDSVYFAICATFSMIVMYDAFNVRRSAGEQAKALNKILEALFKNQVLDTEETLKVILGHSPLQVFAGMILGILIGILSINF